MDPEPYPITMGVSGTKASLSAFFPADFTQSLPSRDQATVTAAVVVVTPLTDANGSHFEVRLLTRAFR